jgi:trans-2,3-dihydro-3-hydroxyanthranilate isomerase
MDLTFHTLDVFTDKRFGGNPLAVVLGADALDADQMQTITREFNLSETIFVMKPRDAANTAAVRIFCPGSEMPFAGHPTLGCAILLAELKNKATCSFETEIRLEEVAGLVPVKVTRIAGPSRGLFTAPVIPFIVGAPPRNERLAAALGLDAADIGFDDHKPAVIEGGPRFFFIPVRSRAALERAQVREPVWGEVTRAVDVDNTYVYTRGGDGKDASFRSRMFAPSAGIAEDPATGSATALLARQILQADSLRDGTHRFVVEQGYEMGRPSDLTLEISVQDRDLASVRVGGQAVRISTGTITL